MRCCAPFIGGQMQSGECDNGSKEKKKSSQNEFLHFMLLAPLHTRHAASGSLTNVTTHQFQLKLKAGDSVNQALMAQILLVEPRAPHVLRSSPESTSSLQSKRLSLFHFNFCCSAKRHNLDQNAATSTTPPAPVATATPHTAPVYISKQDYMQSDAAHAQAVYAMHHAGVTARGATTFYTKQPSAQQQYKASS